ncbi:sulfatase family protein [Pelagicoccus mobilis]|uniref:Sulfatase-like hydrolase/transferase n=1 Tax=Pelagicoccus mobilis TaxID=415221 RepID=A0A934RVI5_9BACT|nr:sulfatase-like hydrolase/transferase [Pelagicoccus mobilis]MBK1875924.1 sulfatase-like hydrolase/transferase [Pelagicoccus mobilis]
MSDYNLLIITPDQLRADYLGCYGHPEVNTQHIDRLSSEGVRFENCYCQAPLCGPSRICFTTSTYVGEHGCRNYGSTIDPAVPNLVSSLKDAGYRTGMFGKNHLFTYEKLADLWDEIDEVCLGNYDDHPKFDRAYRAFELEAEHEYNITGRLTDETIDFIERAEGPFFAWVNYQDPHPAFICPEPYKSLFNPDEIELPNTWENYDVSKQPIRNEVWRKHSMMHECSDPEMKEAIATYMGQIRYVDDSVGRLLDTLERTGKDRTTVVLFFSDHGELLGDHRMTHKLPAFYDSLARIPAIIRHPDGRWADTTFKGLMEEIDLVPTLLDCLGVHMPSTMVGKSWKADLDAGDDSGRESVLCEAGAGAPTWTDPIDNLCLRAPGPPTSFGPGSMIRKGDWKLSFYYDDRCELYNLARDPDESNNLYEDPKYEKIRHELTELLFKRVLGVKVRDIGKDWPLEEGLTDVRFETLQSYANVANGLSAPHAPHPPRIRKTGK